MIIIIYKIMLSSIGRVALIIIGGTTACLMIGTCLIITATLISSVYNDEQIKNN